MPTYDHLDYRPLTAPVDRAQLGAFKRWVRQNGQSSGGTGTSTVVGIVVGVFVAVIFFTVIVSIGGVFLRLLLQTIGVTGAAVEILSFVIGAAAFCVIAGAGALIWKARNRTVWTRRYRMDWFARTNGLAAFALSPNPHYAGSIFGIGSSRASFDRIQSTHGRFLDIGNYRYTTGSGKNSTTHTWGFLALQLDRPLPQMVLDSTANNGLFGGTNLPQHFSRDQVLSLEGDFNRYFTLYCPKEYERDALYIFTPDLMALLIDNAGSFDVEIVDDWMFVYSASALDTADPAVLGRMFRIVDTVGAKTLAQSERYRDERVATATGGGQSDARMPMIAPQGRRLTTTFSWVWIPAAVLFGGWWIFSTFIMGR